MYFTAGENTKRFMGVLNLESYPFTRKELKDNYRKMAQQFHPDINKNQDSESKMKKITEAYSYLQNLSIEDPKEFKPSLFERQESTDIFELKETCSACKGKGFHEDTPLRTVKCDYCDHGSVNTPCKSCNNGIFTLKSGRNIFCKKCNGEGHLKVKCPKCLGHGKTTKVISIKHTCWKCEGSGKIILKPFNPVIPKGAVLRASV
jgi:DnaJ-class molecular chaperone